MTFPSNTRPARAHPRLRAGVAGLLVAMLASACTPSTSTASPPGAPAPRQDVAPMQSPTPDAAVKPDAAITPPDAPAVMYFIYQIDGDGATSYEVQNGSVATFWFGHTFVLDGTTYYTGFSWDTRSRYGKPGEDDPPAPDQQVNIAEATFVRAGDDAQKPWKFRGQEWTVGAFGAYERAPDVDTKRSPVEHRTADGRLLLAVPTHFFDRGVDSFGYELLVFSPKREDDSKVRVWTYLGSVNSGEDNSAACADGDVMPCARSGGTLSFKADGNGLPQVVVTRSGTTIDGPGKTRALGGGDTVVYTYDAKTKLYTTP